MVELEYLLQSQVQQYFTQVVVVVVVKPQRAKPQAQAEMAAAEMVEDYHQQQVQLTKAAAVVEQVLAPLQQQAVLAL
jgi:hypothetical protein